MLHVQERGFSNALGEISKHLKVFRDLRSSSVVAVLEIQDICIPETRVETPATYQSKALSSGTQSLPMNDAALST